ncbi:MAB_1171c family putative transporter [Nocardia huaxiensis]|uniref:DUF6545 domain-containing protein n=1 Tax=Nocardia huaxiensis TaxID=2755382 RepID=A0A7D6Z9D2_9NOCA|nr:MAB_1171c family putative transporter [Nocardia huaxiensis]QLY30188.1 hypothetical protein H0264_34335 [Nocardia huaxiensis]UFS96197.1 hypothetical protein LPY97_37115 [Nocardia huaxiensis]
MPFAILYGSIGALAVFAFAWRLVLAARAPHSPAKWAVAVAILCAAIGFEAAVPQIYTWIGETSGVDNLASLIVYSAVATAVLSQLVWTAYLLDPATGKPRLSGRAVMAVNTAVVIVMAALFFAAPVHDGIHPTDFDHHYATEPLVDAFLGIYLLAYTLGLARIIVLCRGWIPQVRDQLWLRRGLRLLVVGSAIAIGYSIGKTIAITCSWLDIPAHKLNTEIAPAFASLGAAVMLIGYLCPAAIPSMIRTYEHARALPRLRPLLSALREAIPEIAETTAGTPRVGRDRVYRSVIEIRDALLILQPQLTAEVTAAAELLATELGVTGEKRAATVEAARIAAAVRAHRAGGGATGSGERFREPEHPSFEGELRWLVAVAAAYPAVLAAKQTAPK